MRIMKFLKKFMILVLFIFDVKIGNAADDLFNEIIYNELEKSIYICCGRPEPTGVKVGGFVRSLISPLMDRLENHNLREFKTTARAIGGPYNEQKLSEVCYELNRKHYKEKHDALVLSNKRNTWTDEFGYNMVNILKELSEMHPGVDSPGELTTLTKIYLEIGANFFEFWKAFTDEYKLNDNSVKKCLRYYKQCQKIFYAVLYRHDYLKCNKDIIRDIFEALLKDKREEDSLSMDTFFPDREDNISLLLDNLCKDPETLAQRNALSNLQAKSVFYSLKDVTWDPEIYSDLLSISQEKIRKFLNESDPYASDDGSFNMDKLILFIINCCYDERRFPCNNRFNMHVSGRHTSHPGNEQTQDCINAFLGEGNTMDDYYNQPIESIKKILQESACPSKTGKAP